MSESPEVVLPLVIKLPCGCWEHKPGPLEEQQVFLTAEPSLQLTICIFLMHGECESSLSSGAEYLM